MRKLLPLLILSLSFVISSQAQSVAYYPFNSILSVSTNPGKVAWFDLRMQTNSFFSSLSTEFAPAFNLNQNTKARFYLGGGVRANFLAGIADVSVLEGYFVNVGLRSSVIEKIPQIQFAFELSPYAAKGFDSGSMRSRLGIAYNFSAK